MISMGPSGKDLLDAPFSFQIGFGNAGRACCQGSIFSVTDFQHSASL